MNDGERQFNVTPMQAYLLGQFGFLTGAIISNCRMAAEIADQQKELRELAGRLISIQEEERKKIAAEIQDTVTQSLTGIGYKAQFCQEIIDKYPEKLEEELNNLVVNIGHAIRQSRQLMKALRPQVLDGVGVTAALKSLINEFYEDSLIGVDFSYPENISVGQHQEITIFRIVQEALNNIRKHSGATKVQVSMWLENFDEISISVKDNGKGFNTKGRRDPGEEAGLGLRIMKERVEDIGGHIMISSEPGEGCSISVRIPMQETAQCSLV